MADQTLDHGSRVEPPAGFVAEFRAELTEALRVHAEGVAAARHRLGSADYHGRSLLNDIEKLNERTVVSDELLDAVRDSLSGSTDNDRARALLDALQAYEHRSAEHLCDVTYNALIMLSKQVEANHG